MADRTGVDISKLKLTELRQECVSRGLDSKGNKQDLVQRLQAYLEEHAEEEVNEEDVLAEDTEEEEQQQKAEPEVEGQTVAAKEPEESAAKKLVKIVGPMTESEVSIKRLKKRAERFNVPGTAESKKAARAARFGLPIATKGTAGSTKPVISAEKLRERAERFGMNVSSLSIKTEDDEKMKKRKERFGIVTSSGGGGDDVEAKKRKRAERFGIV
ncbi:SAP domain-containing ribonucleoprotein isoform X1 [Amblyraja radiata]|uniref:SAP domain-containing ribonucleoprotein isoform X1 n=1 Tax=Amblyraja radiata TaxID=386614 RepID=UPI0014038A63|nr:SAP domain-containing ribonucleoprotein isoform X1 [Amblyraja radiata]